MACEEPVAHSAASVTTAVLMQFLKRLSTDRTASCCVPACCPPHLLCVSRPAQFIDK